MKFTREAWENAPEGATLEYGGFDWKPVTLIGFSTNGKPVVEDNQGSVWACADNGLRIILPKRKVTVQLWSNNTGYFWACVHPMHPTPNQSWTLHGEHTFEIEGE